MSATLSGRAAGRWQAIAGADTGAATPVREATFGDYGEAAVKAVVEFAKKKKPAAK